jgi:hypothetical protein
MPFDYGLRLHNRQRLANARAKPIEANKNQSVDGAEGLFLRSGSPQNIYLLPQHPNFRLERCPRPKQICDHPNNEPDKISHPATASPDSRSTASQIEFAIGTAADVEESVVKSLKDHLAAEQGKSATVAPSLGDRSDLAQMVSGIVVHRDKLIVRLNSDGADEASDPHNQSLTIPWQKPPSKRSRQILLPHNASRSEVRPEQFERRARLVSAVARGRRWLDDVISGRVTTVTELCAREKFSVRQVNMTISLAFLAPNLVKAAVEGRLPRGIGVERLRDPPTEWSRQFESLGLNPE